MDLLEKFNRTFGSWYEGLFGGGDDVRPKDILRRIIAAMEDHRKEGFDNRIYVPNQYVLEIAVHDEEEKEYLLSFLDRDELESALRRYCQQNHYHIRGALDFTIREVESSELDGKRGEKVRIRCRYNTRITDPEPAASNAALSAEDQTVAHVALHDDGEEGGTVPSTASAALVIYAPDRPPFRYTIGRGSVSIGRSPKSANDIVVDTDGQISKRHARVELDADGRFTIYDVGSTNGTKVNGKRVENRTLNNGDEILIGATRLVFQQMHNQDAFDSSDLASEPQTAGAGIGNRMHNGSRNGENGAGLRHSADMGSSGPAPPIRILKPRTSRLILMSGGQDVDDFLLASETVIGRGVTNDVVLPDRSISTRHARIVHTGDGYALESLSAGPTSVNGIALGQGQSEALRDGDRIELGELALRYEAGKV